MTAYYLKAVHIIFVVTWFAGLFYFPRLLVYLTEANDRPEPDRTILKNQLTTMASRLLYGITLPSALVTLGVGVSMLINRPEFLHYGFMHVKLTLVLLLYGYHFSLHYIFSRIKNGVSTYTSQQLRMWNEVSTLFLISIVFLIVLRNTLDMLWGIAGLVIVTLLILAGIKIYKKSRKDA